MADAEYTKYDDVLTNILVNEKSILGFLSAIFNFLARRTDFYYVPDGQYENMGFPPGVAEELVIKVLRKCDPKNWASPNSENSSNTHNPVNINNEIMCSTVAQEVEVVAEEEIQDCPSETAKSEITPKQIASNDPQNSTIQKTDDIPSCAPPVIPIQTNSDTYNGAEREKYSWSQTIMELGKQTKLFTLTFLQEHIHTVAQTCINIVVSSKQHYQYKFREFIRA
ncbi:unnamed protein product [Diatraea saccharalis]|uniref:NudC N-terminal domain-containing protein n=1 Tax=Diatraea saccharalis TaxID=40085 RepID=A0A9N9QZ77_9NEOP|nr:unnamed protein product [Diatraea saccharalis]